MSDILARNVFKDRKACEYVLRIIMDDEARMDEKKDVAYSLADRKMSVEDISEIIKVNIETVRGWLAGRTPAKNSNRIPSYRSRKQKCPVWGIFIYRKTKQRRWMNIQQLTYIVEIANRKSISRAAEYLFVSQPALSQQIRNLEKELGYRVFHRTSKGLELTEKGNVFYQKAQEMLKDWNRFKEEVMSGTELKKLKIGLGARVYSNRLFPKIAGYFERHPELEVTFYTEAGLDAYAAIKDGSLDMALDRMPENEIGMEKCICFAKELIREKQCILMAPDHPLAQKKNASIMDCREYTMLTGLEHSVEDRLLRKTYGEQNITWKRVIRSDSIDTVMKMVKSGSGIAIGPQSFAEYYGVTAVPLVPARQDSLYFACLKSKKKEPEIREFQRYLTTLVSSVYPD